MAEETTQETGPRDLPSLPLALLPVVLTLGLLALQLFYYGDFTPHIPLICGLAITSLLGVMRGMAWLDIREGIFHVIHVSMPSLAVLIVVGMIIGVWIASGTVPTLIYYGLVLLNPSIFLAAAMVLCAVVSLSLGTSWGTVGTIGLALMGIGAGFGIPPYWTAGAVVSGAFFGDKISPLSDTTNLAPAVTGVTVFDHIKNMLPTTVPAMLIALVVYLAAGYLLIEPGDTSFGAIEQITARLDQQFALGWLPLLPALIVIVLALLRKPPLPSLFAGVLAGAVVAFFLQGEGLHEIFTYAQSGYSIETGVADIDSLLNAGGIQSMMWTISLMLIALGFGGALERTGCLEAIIQAIIGRVKSFAAVQSSAIGTAFATNMVAGDPYISIALPGRMYAPLYRGMGYSTLNLSRAVEEGGTMMSPLIPWNAGGAFVISALGLGIMSGELQNLLYIPLAFACWTAPLIGIFYAVTGLFSPRATDEERRDWDKSDEDVLDLKDHALADSDAG
ncbi:Na+/H+ antiporter NhaC [Cereibacter changlensis JA139]|uniref:Na+/H+ antiporter NhaC n=2 Tax=Cereibacter changlensis TaxID=402884 RepID=A0A2T4JVB1_9RHOB|nr:Na+/H+ antiporter NhaC [Cereibacter changlensis]PTE21852.1 Na+/H+ antiporter NhaC [Cereibacter changlensis JA139]PZX48495.1 transporter (NhaC family) [Cereibacter changlensis]